MERRTSCFSEYLNGGVAAFGVRSGLWLGFEQTQHLFRHVALFLALTPLWGAPQPVLAADAVTTWSLLVAGKAIGGFDPHTATLMHAAMHDALNAITPRYARWTAAAPDEPPAAN
ncbi:MAG: hypothetical protein L0Z46_07780, partial [Nitrospiraceae bacterium]|nr:hypothetical protein [Nitrospiraceae bacterium]